MLSLYKYMNFPHGMLEKLYKGDFHLSTSTYIETPRSGLKRRVKTLSPQDWEDLRYHLDSFEIFDMGESGESGGHDLNYEVACQARNWLSFTDITISKILRIQMSYDDTFEIPRRVRWALQIYEQVILQGGDIEGSSGHTLLPLEPLLDLLASELPLGFHGNNALPLEERGEIRYTEDEARNLIDEMVDERLISYMELGGDSKAAVYCPEYLESELALIRTLSVPVEPTTGDATVRSTLKASMDEDQQKAFDLILDRTIRGSVLGGYPGAGKTYTCGRVANYVGAKNVLALATTGAATQVLAKALPAGVACFTISSAYCNMGNPAWTPRLNRDYLVVDECSMLNMQFLNQLVALVETFGYKCVIITGDPKQLPPIGAGAIFENLVDRNYPNIPVTILSKQHRMEPEALALLSHFEEVITWKKATVASRGHYGSVSFPVSAFERSKETHGLLLLEASTIVKSALSPTKGFAPFTGESVAGSHLTRWLLSAYKSGHCHLISNCVEAARTGYDTGVLTGLIEKFELTATKQFLESTGRCGVRKGSTQRDKYIGNFLLDGIKSEVRDSFRDELHTVQCEITDEYAALCQHVAGVVLSPGSFVRCRKNLNFSFWAKKRCEAEREKFGILCTSNLANGLTFYVQADGVLINTESGTEIVITDRRKASKLLSLSWCSTTHKLQGDQGARSYYLHTSSKAENKLVYVALSRGREKNVCLVNKSDAMFSWKGPQMEQSVKRLSALAVQYRGKL